MRNAVFTIVAKNYIGLAQVLEKSVQRNADADFFIFVADEFDDDKIELPSNAIISKTTLGIEIAQWTEMSFKYNLVEFCTAIKPYCFEFLFGQKSHDKVVYLDPDVYVFNSLNPVFSDLDKFSIVLTPHIVDMQTPFRGVYSDYLFLVNGTFNLGFIGLKHSLDATFE
jgi:lipopolysaccharide biosynthesis glycosyltransferase